MASVAFLDPGDIRGRGSSFGVAEGKMPYSKGGIFPHALVPRVAYHDDSLQFFPSSRTQLSVCSVRLRTRVALLTLDRKGTVFDSALRRSIDWSIDWLFIDLLIARLFNWLVDWLSNKSVKSLFQRGPRLLGRRRSDTGLVERKNCFERSYETLWGAGRLWGRNLVLYCELCKFSNRSSNGCRNLYLLIEPKIIVSF